MDGVVAYILGKSYTKKSLIGIGALAGAPCQVQSIDKVDKTTTITLKWEDNLGEVHTQSFEIEDGLDGVSVTDANIDPTGNLILTLSDGNSIDCGKVIPQYDTLPSPSASNVGSILQYIGNNTSNYTNGYYYKCVNDGGTYKWVNIKVQDAEDVFRYNTLPTANNSNVGKIVQYIGNTTADYTNGYYYQCKFDGTNYKWVQKDTQPSGGTSGNSVVNGYYNPTDHKFYEEPAYINEIIGEVDKIYISDDTNVQYRWDGTQFVTISSSVEVDDALSTTSENPVQNKVITLTLNELQGSLANKVDKETNKGLSTNDFTDEFKEKVINLQPIYLIGSGLNLDSATGRLTATGMSIPIDDHLDDTSINPVQNKVIALTIDQMQGSILEKIQKKLAATADDFVVFTNNGDIADSGISKDVVPSTVSISNKLLVASDLSAKADKVSGATDDDIALLDVTGNLKDSNKKLSDYQEKLTKGDGININSNTISLDIDYLTASRIGYIPTSEKGAHNGIAELDITGKVPSSQLPSYVDDIIDGYYKEEDGKFYEDSSYTTEIVGESGKIYISVDTDIQYRWTGIGYAALGGALQLGETASTAYRGDRGKIAYDHSQITNGSNPHNTTANNINLKVPITALSGSKLDAESTFYGINTELGKKADKVSNTTNGDLAGLDTNGNLTDSGILASNVVVKSNTVGLIKNDGSIDTTNYASKVTNATADNFATLNSSGNIVDSGISKNIVPSGASSSNKLVTVSDVPDELNDLDDVVITSATLANAQILAYNSTSGKWENQTGQAAIGGAVFKGSILFANLPTTGMENGDWYDIKDAFTTDNRFEEGAGISCAAGTDIIWVNNDSKWNILTPSGVYSFNGRTGAVSPASGDYSKSDVGLGNVVNTGDSATPVSGGTTKFTTGGAYTELNKKADKVANATNGNFAGLDANGNLTDSGKKASDFATDNQTFSQASTRTNIVSGESFSTIFGKIMKWFADLKDLAFINKPSSGQTTTFLRGDGTWVAPSGATSWATPINLIEGQTYQDFADLSSSYAYEVWFDCANNVAPPTLTSLIFTSSTTATATFSAVTSAQTGTGGNECKIRLRMISLS